MIDVKREVRTEFPGYFRAPMDEFTEMSKNGVTAVYLYSENVLSCGKITRFDEGDRRVRVMSKFGVTMAPVSLFTRFLGAKAASGKKGITLSLGNKSIDLGISESIGGAPCAFYSGKVIYVPVDAVASALELSYSVFHKDRLTVFADKSVLDALSSDALLVRGACYAVFGEYRTDHLTHEDFVKVKDKWRSILVGSPDINDCADPDMAEKLAAISDACEKKWKELNKDSEAPVLFGTEPPAASNDLLVQYSGIWTLAKAYGTSGTRYYRNEELKDDILYCLEWMYENMYGESIIEGRGWRDPHLFNWWEWMTGAIEPMTDTMLVMEEHLDMDTVKKYFRCYDYVCTFHRPFYREDHASTRLKVGTKVALLLEDRERLYYRFLDYDLQYEPLGPQKGKYTDYVCWTHGFPYNMMYGLVYLNRTLFVASNLHGSAMEYTSPDFYDMFSIARYMYDAAMYRGRGFAVFRGRDFGAEKDSGSNALNGILPMIGAFGEEEDVFLKKMIKRGCSDPEVKKCLIARSSVHDLAKIKDILADESISDENDVELAYSWFTADRFTQHRNDYAFMLAMPSSRHMSYESINSAHKRGWYTGDGALYLYTNADSVSFDYHAFQSNPSICYRMPGVTADERERTLWSYRSGWKPSKSFSGSMDFEEKYGVAAFDYEPYHYSGHEADGTTDDGYGGGFTYYENDLTARKSYFFFDKECVCLGAGITSSMRSPVNTTVEHRRLVAGADKIYVGDELISDSAFEKRLTTPACVTLEGVGGYVFPKGMNVKVSRYAFDPKDEEADHYAAHEALSATEYFELAVLHGSDPKDASYCYVILPLADEISTRVYTSAPEIEVLSNTPALQAVRKPSLGIVAAALHESGRIGAVTASVPSLVMYKETETELLLSLCDPTQKACAATFTVDGEYDVVCASPELSCESADGNTVIHADLERLAGKPLRIRMIKRSK